MDQCGLVPAGTNAGTTFGGRNMHAREYDILKERELKGQHL